MKNLVLIIINLFFISSQIHSSLTPSLKHFAIFDKIESTIKNEKSQNGDSEGYSLNPPLSEEQIKIYYGLNESHSNNWAQLDNYGNVGIVYFQRSNENGFTGTLKYKTILTNGMENIEDVTEGTHLENSVLLFDEESKPHIFVAQSTNQNQWIDQFYKDGSGQWQSEKIINFHWEGGLFIYELSADKGPDGSFHFLILKTRSDIDSDDFMEAWRDSYLYHLSNVSGNWQKELVHNYNMAYTYDMYVKSSKRQDIKVDKDGYVHVIFSEQIDGEDDPSQLYYANNKNGNWSREIILSYDYGRRDDAGWFPSLCLDNNGIPYVSCMYINRVMTYSAVYCRLYLLKRLGANNWQKEIIADADDGYHGSDGRQYTGGLSHLVFDADNTPHIIFSDIASTHWPVLNQRLNVGNIRYVTLEDGNWNFTTIYRQPLPTGFYNATEMNGMCLLISDETERIHVIGQELIIESKDNYSCSLINFTWDKLSHVTGDEIYSFDLHQNYPNPFNPTTLISYTIPTSKFITIKIFDSLGKEIQTIVNEYKPAGAHSLYFDAGELSSGIYFYKISAGDDFTDTKKMVIIH